MGGDIDFTAESRQIIRSVDFCVTRDETDLNARVQSLKWWMGLVYSFKVVVSTDCTWASDDCL